MSKAVHAPSLKGSMGIERAIRSYSDAVAYMYSIVGGLTERTDAGSAVHEVSTPVLIPEACRCQHCCDECSVEVPC